MKKIIKFKDIPLGSLIMTLSMFLFYFAWAMVGYVDLFRFMILVFFVIAGQKVFSFGYNMIKGLIFYVK